MKIKNKIKLIITMFVIISVLLTATLVAAAVVISGNDSTVQYNGSLFNPNVALKIALVLSIIIVILVMYTVKIFKLNRKQYDMLNEAIDRMIEGDYDTEIKIEGDNEIELLIKNVEWLRKKIQNEIRAKKDAEDATRDAISNISHDLKTPMSAIRGYAEGILDGVASTPEKREKYARIIITKVNFMNQLLSELSYYSSIDIDGIMGVYQPVSVHEYFGDCVDEISMDLQMKNINCIYINSVDEDVMICIDVEKISKVIRNIISNSEKYITDDNGTIILKIEEVDDENIMVSIQDNGCGISPDCLPHIFDRYYKAEVARPSVGGGGIGLSIVKKIVEDHGGKVSAQSTLGQGTVISFTLKKYKETI